MNAVDCRFTEEHEKKMAMMKPIWRETVIKLAGTANTKGIEISGTVRRLANVYDAIFNTSEAGSEVTSPRLSILVRLYIDEKMGRTEGVTPTSLSHMQNVGKNTISSLVRGLEEQGYIQRENDSSDRRIYRLKLTEAGRKLIIEQAPQHIEYLNLIASDLSEEEQDQLLQLLDKLLKSLMMHSNLRKMKMHRS
jgi:Transcriptional regulators